MITNIQQDCLNIYNYVTNKDIPEDPIEKKNVEIKTELCVFRVFTAIAMGCTLALAAKATLILFSSTVTAVFLLAVATALFVILHDFFRMATTVSARLEFRMEFNDAIPSLMGLIKSLAIADIVFADPFFNDQFGEKHISTDTFFSKIWDDLLVKFYKPQE